MPESAAFRLALCNEVVRELTFPEQCDLAARLGYDALEFYVGNAKQAAHYYGSVFGFSASAYRGPETGVRDRVSHVMEQNDIRL